MEEKINIAEILKGKKNGLRLYSPIFGECTFCCVREDTNDICVKKHNGVKEFFDSKGLYYNTGEVMLFPSKEMRDWSKFFKKGDVLLYFDGKCKVIFDKFDDDKYTSFIGKHYLESYGKDGELQDYEEIHCGSTVKYTKESEEATQTYINTIEERLGGKLNRETLEIEKTHPEFKDGDIVYISGMGYLAYGIVKRIDNSSKKLEYYVLNDMSTLKFEDWLSFEDKQIQPITETQQIILFDALAKKGKAWDAEKKEFIDLKPKVEFKPFDKVLCRNSKDDTWEADFFARLTRKEIDYTQSGKYLCVGDLWMYCIPYNEDTAHLLGTADDWKGGEG